MVTYEQIEIVYHNLTTNMELMSYPNVQQFIGNVRSTINDPAEIQRKKTEMVNFAREKLLKGYTYFMSHFWDADAKRYDNLQLFKIYRILNPKYVKSLDDTFTTGFVETELRKLIDTEKWAHILNEEQLQQIISQTTEYKRLCSNENFEDLDYRDILKRIVLFWKTNHDALSAWWVLVERAYLTQSSSASAERALSVITRVLTNNMKNALNDVVEGSMMLIINGDSIEEL